MTSYSSSDLRRLVIERAAGRCEYCRIRESDTFPVNLSDSITRELIIGSSTFDS